MRFNKKLFSWTGAIAPSCKNRWSLEAVATHEMGHVFGLGHVPEETHGKLTMSPQLNGPCQAAEATLGLGDVAGLEQRY